MSLLRFANTIIRYLPKLFFFNLFIVCLGGFVEAFSVLSIAPIIDYITDPGLEAPSKITSECLKIVRWFGLSPSLFLFMGIFAFLMFMRAIFNIKINYLELLIKYRFLGHFLTGSFGSFFRSGLSFFNNIQQGMIINTFSSEANTVGNSIASLTRLIASAVKFISFIIIPFSISWQLSLIAIIAFVLAGLPTLVVNKISYRKGEKNVLATNNLQIILQESITAVKTIFAFANQEKMIRSYDQSFQKYEKITIPYQLISPSLRNILEPVFLTVFFIIFFLGIERYQMKSSEVLTMLYAFRSGLPHILTIFMEKNRVFSFIPSYEQMLRLQKSANLHKFKNGKVIFQGLKNCLEFKNVQFGYSENKDILKNINIKIFKDQTVAIVGKSGSGKTTFADIMMGFYRPKQGSILVDGQNLNELEIGSYQKRIGYISQEPILFNTTIKENLLWADEAANEKQLFDALEKAYAIDFVQKLPDKLDTLTGDRGVKLSGGEKQRIALARVLLRNPEILILDEATSSLDTESERFIQKTIYEISKNCTTVIIAHRLSTIKEVQNIYVFEDGEVKEEGGFQFLVEHGKIFKRLVQNQFL